MVDDKVVDINESMHQNSEMRTKETDKEDLNSSTQNEKIELLSEQLEKQKNDYLYLRAEFENFKRNTLKERSDLLKYGGERIVRDLLEILDNFERALEVEIKPENLEIFHKGIDLTAKELKTTLEKHGISQVEILGQPFDPAQHEALSIEASDKIPPGHVLRVFKKPYKYHEKTIRTGQVVVSKKLE